MSIPNLIFLPIAWDIDAAGNIGTGLLLHRVSVHRNWSNASAVAVLPAEPER